MALQGTEALTAQNMQTQLTQVIEPYLANPHKFSDPYYLPVLLFYTAMKTPLCSREEKYITYLCTMLMSKSSQLQSCAEVAQRLYQYITNVVQPIINMQKQPQWNKPDIAPLQTYLKTIALPSNTNQNEEKWLEYLQQVYTKTQSLLHAVEKPLKDLLYNQLYTINDIILASYLALARSCQHNQDAFDKFTHWYAPLSSCLNPLLVNPGPNNTQLTKFLLQHVCVHSLFGSTLKSKEELGVFLSGLEQYELAEKMLKVYNRGIQKNFYGILHQEFDAYSACTIEPIKIMFFNALTQQFLQAQRAVISGTIIADIQKIAAAWPNKQICSEKPPTPEYLREARWVAMTQSKLFTSHYFGLNHNQLSTASYDCFARGGSSRVFLKNNKRLQQAQTEIYQRYLMDGAEKPEKLQDILSKIHEQLCIKHPWLNSDTTSVFYQETLLKTVFSYYIYMNHDNLNNTWVVFAQVSLYLLEYGSTSVQDAIIQCSEKYKTDNNTKADEFINIAQNKYHDKIVQLNDLVKQYYNHYNKPAIAKLILADLIKELIQMVTSKTSVIAEYFRTPNLAPTLTLAFSEWHPSIEITDWQGTPDDIQMYQAVNADAGLKSVIFSRLTGPQRDTLEKNLFLAKQRRPAC